MVSNNRGCDKQEELVTYLYGEATPESAKQFESHIRECLTCARELREFSSVRDTLQTWELDTLPHIVIEPKRTFGMIVRELFVVTPIWAKGLAAVAAMLLFAAFLNIEVSIGNMKLGPHLFNKAPIVAPAPQPIANPDYMSKEEVAKLVEQKVNDSERRTKEDMLVKLTSFQQELRKNREDEMVRLMAGFRRDQQQQIRRVVADQIARNDLNFSVLFNGLGSDKDKDDNK